MAQSPHDSVHIVELYAILVVLDLPEPLNIVTFNMQKVVLHIETTEHIPDGSELILLFIQL